MNFEGWIDQHDSFQIFMALMFFPELLPFFVEIDLGFVPLNSGIGRLGDFCFANDPVGMVPKGNGMVAVIAADVRFEHHFSLRGEAGGLSVSGRFQEVRIGRPTSIGVFFLMQPLGV